MKDILCFAGSNHSQSINHQWVLYLASQIRNHSVEVVKLTDFPVAIYSQDTEREQGFPDNVKKLYDFIRTHRALLLSVNEHNGNPSAFFKNHLDWLSRLDRDFLNGIKIFLSSTSNGKRGGMSSLSVVENMLPRFKGEIVETFSLPSFSENFSTTKQELLNAELIQTIREKLRYFENQISK